MNILSNAIDALTNIRNRKLELASSSEGERQDFPSLPLSGNASPWIRIRTEVLEDNRVLIAISDNGSGMAESVKSRIFDPFFTTKPVGKNTGLGLSISYQIVVERHGGTLRCMDAPGGGTEFAIEIPIQQR
jgi:signal transduction histidine kinase